MSDTDTKKITGLGAGLKKPLKRISNSDRAIEESEREKGLDQAIEKAGRENEKQEIPKKFSYHVSVSYFVLGENRFLDATINLPTTIKGAEEIEAVRRSMAQQVPTDTSRVTILNLLLLK